MYKKQEHCDPNNPADDQHGDWWDHKAYDPEHKLVLCVVPGRAGLKRPRPWSEKPSSGREASP